MQTKLLVIQGDITQLKVDAIVNADDSLAESAFAMEPAYSGEAVITDGGEMPSRYIIHASGPIWSDGTQEEALQLGSAYKNALQLAMDNHAKTIAFPNISTGASGYPKTEAARIALTTVRQFLKEQPGFFSEIIFVCWDTENYHLYKDMLGSENRVI